MAAPANIRGTCCNSDHRTGQKVDDPKDTERNEEESIAVEQPLNINVATPVLLIPLVLFVALFVAAEMSGVQELLWTLFFLTLSTAVGLLVLREQSEYVRNALSGLPQPVAVKLLMYLLGSLAVGFVAPVHLLPEAWLKLVLVMSLMSYGLGLYYDSLTGRSGPDFAPALKWLSLIAVIVLIAIGVGYETDILN